MFAQLKSSCSVNTPPVLDIPKLSVATVISESTSIFDNLVLTFDYGALQETLTTPASSATPLLSSNQQITPRHHSIFPPTPKAVFLSNVASIPPRNITSSKILILAITSPRSTDSANASLNILFYRVPLSATILPSSHRLRFPRIHHTITSHPRLPTKTTTLLQPLRSHSHQQLSISRPPTNTSSPAIHTSSFHF